MSDEPYAYVHVRPTLAWSSAGMLRGHPAGTMAIRLTGINEEHDVGIAVLHPGDDWNPARGREIARVRIEKALAEWRVAATNTTGERIRARRGPFGIYEYETPSREFHRPRFTVLTVADGEREAVLLAKALDAIVYAHARLRITDQFLRAVRDTRARMQFAEDRRREHPRDRQTLEPAP